MLARDLHLLVLGIAGDPDDLHAVTQRPAGCSSCIGRRHEQHFDRSNRHPGSCRGTFAFCSGSSTSSRADDGSPRKSAPILSISSSTNSGLLFSASLMRLNDLARQRADIGAPVTADLGLVAHAAQRQAHELLPIACAIELAQRGLADAGRSDQAQDRWRVALLLELARPTGTHDAVLDLFPDRSGPCPASPARRRSWLSWASWPRGRTAASQDSCARGGSGAPATSAAASSSSLLRLSRASMESFVLATFLFQLVDSSRPSSSPSSFWIAFICSSSRC